MKIYNFNKLLDHRSRIRFLLTNTSYIDNSLAQFFNLEIHVAQYILQHNMQHINLHLNAL